MPSTIELVDGAPQARNITLGIVSPRVRVLKADGTPYVGTQVKWLFPSSSGPSGAFGFGSNPQNTTTNASGIAQLPALCAVNSIEGTWNLTASLVAEPSVSLLLPFRNTNDSGVVLGLISIRSGEFQSKPTNTVFTDIVYDVINTKGGSIPSFQMRVRKLSPTPADFKMNGTTSTAAQNIYTSSIGRLTVDIESGATAGTAKIRADRSSGNPYGCYCDVYETIYTPTPTTVQINAGNNQSADVSTAFGATMKAKVVDAGGAAIAGVTVTFTNPASGASALFSNASNVCTANTDGSGIATSLSFTANAVPGAWGCVASCSPATSATFTQNNIGTGAELDDTLMYSEA